jgi:GR25 family glycosyltransferase involved in LPS biosynthesis
MTGGTMLVFYVVVALSAPQVVTANDACPIAQGSRLLQVFKAHEKFGRVLEEPTLYTQAFVVNRDVDQDRLAMFATSAEAAGVRFERFPAIDKANLDAEKLIVNGEITQDVALVAQIEKRRGNYACALSHIRLWQRLASADDNSTFLVFEDDSVIPPDFHAKLRAALATVPADWDMLYLNHERLKGNAVNADWLRPSSCFPKCKGKNALQNAYVVRPPGLRRILKFMSPIAWINGTKDAFMRRHFDAFQAYFLIRQLVPQAGTKSVRTGAFHVYHDH